MKIELFVDGSSYMDKPSKDPVNKKFIDDYGRNSNGYITIFRKPYKASSSAYGIYIKDKLITKGGKFHDGATSNYGEATAVLLGLERIESILKNLDKKYTIKYPVDIIVYTDSFITCESCRSWIYGWIRKYGNGTLLNSSGEEVANQDIFKEIYYRFLRNKSYKIKFYHINSHIIENALYNNNVVEIEEYFIKRHKDNTIKFGVIDKLIQLDKFKKAKKTFKEKNKEDIEDMELLRLLIHNSFVDNLAKEYLQNGLGRNKVG